MEGPFLCKPFLLAMFCPPHICKSWYTYHQMIVHWSKHSEWLFQGAVVQSDITGAPIPLILQYLNVLFVFPMRESKVALVLTTPTGKFTGYNVWLSWLAWLAPLIYNNTCLYCYFMWHATTCRGKEGTLIWWEPRLSQRLKLTKRRSHCHTFMILCLNYSLAGDSASPGPPLTFVKWPPWVLKPVPPNFVLWAWFPVTFIVIG